jgi:hypothetical protein
MIQGGQKLFNTVLWIRASLPIPSDDMTSTDNGWQDNDGLLQPLWFEGRVLS